MLLDAAVKNWQHHAMNRPERLLALLQALRRQRYPVSGNTLAETLGVSIRTLYRDIASLQAQGADIRGEAGVGYVLRPGFMLPPLMFSQSELEALVLGFRWTAKFADAQLVNAATDALAKISNVLPDELRRELESTTLLVGPRIFSDRESVDMEAIRSAIRNEKKASVSYEDASGNQTDRTIWPFALGFFPEARVLVAWCEKRNDFRHFHTERIKTFDIQDIRYPRRRGGLLREWRSKGLHARRQD